MATSHTIPCTEGHEFWCYHSKERPFDLAKGLFVIRFSKRRDVEMDRLPHAKNDCLFVAVSVIPRARTCTEYDRVALTVWLSVRISWADIGPFTYQRYMSDRCSRSHEWSDSGTTQPSRCCFGHGGRMTWRFAESLGSDRFGLRGLSRSLMIRIEISSKE